MKEVTFAVKVALANSNDQIMMWLLCLEKTHSRLYSYTSGDVVDHCGRKQDGPCRLITAGGKLLTLILGRRTCTKSGASNLTSVTSTECRNNCIVQ